MPATREGRRSSRPGPPLAGARPGLWAVAAWAALIALSTAWGAALVQRGTRIFLPTPPLFGHLRFQVGPSLAFAAALAAATAVAGPSLAARLPWRRLLAAAWLLALAWAVSLAASEGWQALAAPLTAATDYLHDLHRVGSPGAFLGRFTDEIATYTTHVRSHPPGFLLVLWGLDRLGLGGAGWAAAACIAVGASSVPAVLVAVRRVAGEDGARRAAPFVALAPAAVWVATSADAFFAGVGAWSVALFALSTSRLGRAGTALAAASGLLFGVALLLSYGLALLALLPVAIAVRSRRWGLLGAWAAATGAVIGGVAGAGFWWLEGLAATRAQYLAGAASSRPYLYFLVANLGAFALALGPAVAAGLAHLRHRRLWLVVGATLAMVALADLSGMSKGEVERIWLPFAPWLLVAAGAVPDARPWLAAQAGLALALEAGLDFPW